MRENRPPSLKNNIHTIFNGTEAEKYKLHGKHFFLADAPQFMKDKGINGEYFTVRFGVIERHKGKDADHNLTEQDWINLCDEIIRPFLITKHENGYRFFTNAEINGNWMTAGVDVKNVGKDLWVNSISTAFGFRDRQACNIVYTSEKITPEQKALLDGPDSLSLLSVQGGTDDLISLSSSTPEKSR
jgi:hypothetical protein